VSVRLPQEIIRTKRDGERLSADDIALFVEGLTSGRVTEGQAAAFAMAVFFRGLSVDERVALTRAMTASGTTLAWDLPGPVLDKHSTGGVGDAVSLVLAPAVAACGGFVPMIAGRGLGHTGGTLDKLASIPGYQSQPDVETFRRVVHDVGCAIIGQTADLAPADKRLYAIRDVTGTVESLDLITTSILAKKLAGGLQGLVMDVTVGSGAFMPDLDAGRALAASLVEVANGAGLPTHAILTDMDQPLASAAGNAVEVWYAVDFLSGRRRQPRFHEVTVALGAEMLVLGGIAPDLQVGERSITRAIASGHAAEIFAGMVAALGGPADVLEHPARHLACAPVTRPVHPERGGYVEAVSTRALGLAVVALGGGRVRPDDDIDPAVGLVDLAGVGERVDSMIPLGIVHARSEAAADEAAATLLRAYQIAEAPVACGPVILERVGAPS
jgi:thymidine phosphorylase